MNAGTKPNALEGIGVLVESESLLELGLTFLKDTENVEVDLQAWGDRCMFTWLLNFFLNFVTKLKRNKFLPDMIS